MLPIIIEFQFLPEPKSNGRWSAKAKVRMLMADCRPNSMNTKAS